MLRKDFIIHTLGAGLLWTINPSLSLLGQIQNTSGPRSAMKEKISFGAVHLRVTNMRKSIQFWQDICGLELKNVHHNIAQLGTSENTLIVLHEEAIVPFKHGYSGLYHFAFHVPNINEFAKIAAKLISVQYPFSPVDHTMSKSIYLNDPDGINIEFALETPERFKTVLTNNGLQILATDGSIHSASASLDIASILKEYNKETLLSLHPDTKIGHIHLSAQNIDSSYNFYKSLGLERFNYLPQFLYADLGAGGLYKHRIAMNSWHGKNKPPSPITNAGLHHFEILLNTREELTKAAAHHGVHLSTDDNYTITDPNGNLMLVSIKTT